MDLKLNIMKKVTDNQIETSGKNPASTKWTWLENNWMKIAVAALIIGVITLVIVFA